MLKRLTYRLQRYPRLGRVLTLVFLIVVILFSVWFFWSFWETVRFRDNLIARKYEGSLSGELGFLAVLTSEASRKLDFSTADEQARTARVRAVLMRAKTRLEDLGSEPSRSPRPQLASSLAAAPDEGTLLRLLASPELAILPLSALGLEVADSDLPAYPFLQTAARGARASSFVFIPVPLVGTRGDKPDLSQRVRKELVFSKIAEGDIRGMLAELKPEKIYQVYYIACSDFIRIVNAESDDQRSMYLNAFLPLRSFADRTYFHETRRSPDHFRQSEPYIDVAGGGLINTYSIYFLNKALGVCGMIGLDRRLQPLQSFWDDMDLGATSGALRDFTFSTYDLDTKRLRRAGKFPTRFRKSLANEIETREPGVKSGIQRLEIDGATVFTVPRGGDQIACFVFDPARILRKNILISGLGFLAITSFVLMVWLDSYIHRSAEAAKRSQAEIVKNLHGGYVLVNKDDVILSANERFSSLVGGPVVGERITSYFAPESVNEYEQLKPRGGFEFAGRVRRADGIFSPEIITSALLSRQGRRNQRMFILIHSADLEQTIARKFLNIFSHALKSPVHSLLLIADLFRRKNALPKFDYYYSQMQRKVQEFSTLTDNVLRFSALDVKEISMELQSINVAKVLRQVLSAARERAKAQDLYLREEIPDDLRALADEGLLQVIFNNLIDNALKYTPRGGVTVQASDLITRVQVVVADTGPGVPEREREGIFDLFVQGSRPGATSREGLGLGLYISKKYVEAMGGTLKYEPVLDQKMKEGEVEKLEGSRFVVELPKHERGNIDEQEDKDSIA